MGKSCDRCGKKNGSSDNQCRHCGAFIGKSTDKKAGESVAVKTDSGTFKIGGQNISSRERKRRKHVPPHVAQVLQEEERRRIAQ